MHRVKAGRQSDCGRVVGRHRSGLCHQIPWFLHVTFQISSWARLKCYCRGGRKEDCAPEDQETCFCTLRCNCIADNTQLCPHRPGLFRNGPRQFVDGSRLRSTSAGPCALRGHARVENASARGGECCGGCSRWCRNSSPHARDALASSCRGQRSCGACSIAQRGAGGYSQRE